jgi:hypothetical protein
MSAFPDAAIVAALPPKSSLDAAITIAAGDRIGLVEAPLAREAAQIDVLPRGAVDVLVAHGWADLPAAKSFARLRQRWKTAVVEVHGRPEKAGGEFDEVLVHALALVNVLLPDALVRSAKRVDSASFEGRFVDGQGATLELRTSTEGQSLSICVEVATGTIRHLWTPDSSSYEVPDFSDRIRTMEVPGAMQQFVSGLASLATGPHRHAAIRAERRAALRLLTHVRRRSREAPAHRIMGGDDLADAVKVMRLAHAVWCQLA